MDSILNPSTLKNLVFDLGDVIIPIDLTAPVRNFAMLANLPEDEVWAIWKEHNFINHYETGLLDDAAFRAEVRQLLKNDVWADEVIDTAWNTVLLDLPVERIARIQELKANHRLFLLSNTSPIHIRRVNDVLTQLNLPTLEQLFERVFYSYEVRLAKPSPDIYRHVLTEAGLVAEETAFFDDNAANIQAAAELGIQAVHVQPPMTIIDYVKDL
ncbi:HAD family hydrolase [Spirosoma utsteinense]|uniref:Hydrolase of the HAD superfamily n=1 Tax=Spirosoma utsteinense TaxID=2585773 RepID=A0ABR6WBP6_9BACT|nr:HAD family phosphatase [Spirosoma utsteinense]MBC3785268.1 putative hydrolase of the HAD superfamily [Spirosoma utsteinense]MBC3793928.1 putative hydrolase of the HAD superfamily [Spirosoma utsteinense]